MADYYARVRGHYASGRKWGFGWHINSSKTADAMQTAWVTAVTNWWTNGTYGMQTLYPTGTVLDSVDITTLTAGLTALVRTAPAILTLAGTSADNGLPDRNSMVMSLRGATLGRGDRGRSFLPAPTEGTVANGEYQSTSYDRAGIAARALLFAITSGGDVVFVFNRLETIQKPTPLTRTTIITAEVSSKVASQERRVKQAAPVYG